MKTENRLLELADLHAERIATAGRRAIARAHAAGAPAYVGMQPDAHPNEIVRLDPDGRRFVVEIVPGGDDVIVRELAPRS